MHQVRSNTRLHCQHLRVAKNSWKFSLIQSFLVLSFSSCFPPACVITSRRRLIWQRITQWCQFSFCERINLSKVTANRMPSQRQTKAAVTLDTVNLTLWFYFAITQASLDTHTPANTNTQAQRLAPTQIYFPSPWEGRSAHTHTRAYTDTQTVHTPTGRLYRVPASMSNLAVAQSSWNLAVMRPLDKYPWQSKSQSICSMAGGDLVKC